MKKILMVCLGNICRSPLAEGVLKEKLKHLNQETFVDSAGIIAFHEGQEPDPRSTAVAQKYGIDISSQLGRQIKPVDFDTFHEIYAMDKHVHDQLLKLAETKEHKEKVILFMESKYPGSGREVPDPYYGGPEGFENVYRMIDEACEVIAERILNQQKS
jgi:protein-tyrosine phosphatase